MPGSNAQLIALTSYGNEFLKNGNLEVQFFPGNTTFQHCAAVNFHDFKSPYFFMKPRNIQVAANPIEWFHLLKKESCRRLRLYYAPSPPNKFGPEYSSAGFVGGGGVWLIETIFNQHSHFWWPRWVASNQEQLKWAVSYARRIDRFPTINQQHKVTVLKQQLEKALLEIEDFARTKNLEDWDKVFEKARHILSDPNPVNGYYHHDLLIEKNYSLEARQLLIAASMAWVFGGMGSWNDLGLSKNERYQELSNTLYNTINKSMIAATNSY